MSIKMNITTLVCGRWTDGDDGGTMVPTDEN